MLKLLFAIYVSTLPLYALDFQSNAINVKGVAKVSVEPDRAEFRLGITVKHKEIDSALARLSKLTESVNKIFKKFKLDKNSARIKNIQIQEDTEYDRENRRNIFLGYIAKRYYEIKFTHMQTLSKFLLESNLAGANDLNNLNFSHTKADSIENSLLKKAIDNAKKSALVAAKSSGVKIQRVSVISDQPPDHYAYQSRVQFDMPRFGDQHIRGMSVSAKGKLRGKPGYQALFEIEPGTIEIVKSVWVTYQIK